MAEKPTYLLIDSQVLPDVFLKVVRAKEMLARGKVKSAAMAARACGISRSAFYKYKDSRLYNGDFAALHSEDK